MCQDGIVTEEAMNERVARCLWSSNPVVDLSVREGARCVLGKGGMPPFSSEVRKEEDIGSLICMQWTTLGNEQAREVARALQQQDSLKELVLRVRAVWGGEALQGEE